MFKTFWKQHFFNLSSTDVCKVPSRAGWIASVYSGLKSARAGSSFRLSSTGLQTRLAFVQYSLFLITNLENKSINLNNKFRKILNCFTRDLLLQNDLGISEQKVKQVNFLLFHFFLLFVVIIIFCIFVAVVVVAVRIFWPNRFFLQSN